MNELAEELVREVVSRLSDQPPSVGYVSKAKLASDLGLTERAIRTFREQGMPGIRVGKIVLYDPAQVRRWIGGHQ